jgi:hypothetical protein
MHVFSGSVSHILRTYVTDDLPDLDEIAVRLVRAGAAQTICTSKGKCIWLSNGVLRREPAIVQPSSVKRSGSISLTTTIDVIDSLTESVILYSSDRNHSSRNSLLYPDWIRADLGLWRIETEGSIRDLHIWLKILQPGIILIELNLEAVGVESANLIGDFANLPLWEVTQIYPPGSFVAGMLLTAGMAQSRVMQWVYRRFPQFRSSGVGQFAKAMDLDIRVPISENSRAATLVTSAVSPLVGNRPISLLDVGAWAAQTALEMAAVQATVTTEGGRVHIFLRRFEDQRSSIEANESEHGDWFGRFLARKTSAGRASLVENARAPEADYSVYFSGSTALWVWTTEGIERSRSPEATLDHHNQYLSEPRTFAETLEHGVVLQKKTSAMIEAAATSRALAEVRRVVLMLEEEMRTAGPSGEIRKMLRCGWEASELPEMRTHIDQLFELQRSTAEESKALATNRLTIALTTAFGVLAIPSFVSDILLPIWHRFFAFSYIIDAEATTVILTLIMLSAFFIWIYSLQKKMDK